MPEQTQKRLHPRIILIGIIVLLAAVLTALCLFIAGQETRQPDQTQSVPETTVPTTEPTLPQSAYVPEDFAYDGGYLTCLAADTMLGIDVSHHQGDIDWAAVKAAGVDFVMVRLGYRSQAAEGTLKTDRYVLQNLTGAREAGLLVGAYFYSQAVNPAEAVAEAQYALSILDGFRLDLPLAYDWEQEERTAQVSVRALTLSTLAFCNTVEKAGYQAMVYFNSYQARNLADMNRLQKYPWWLAMYDVGNEFPCRFDVWQYTCTGSVPGIQGDVDVNVMIVG